VSQYDYHSNKHALRAGTHYDNGLTSAYEISNWPAQTGQVERAFQWFDPLRESGAVREAESTTDALDGTRAAFGGYNWQWVFGPLSPSMVQYIRATVFGGGWSAAVTARTWDKAYGWRTFNALAVWSEPAEAADGSIPLGYHRLTITFRNGVIANPGGSFSDDFSDDFDT
jgi:hypothetical protein